MGALLALLARPLIDAAASAFGRVLLDFLKSWLDAHAMKQAGRAEAERDAAVAGAQIEHDMDAVEMPDLHELLRRLGEGTA
jgi:hypothetical protein